MAVRVLVPGEVLGSIQPAAGSVITQLFMPSVTLIVPVGAAARGASGESDARELTASLAATEFVP